MKTINATDALNEKILRLELQQAQEWMLLKEEIHTTYESLKPANLVRNTLQEMGASSDVKNTLVNNVIGLTGGYLSKLVILGSSANPIKRILGTLLQFTVGNFVANNSDTIKSVGEVVIKRLFNHKTPVNHEN